MASTQLKQVSGYVPQEMKDKLQNLRTKHRFLTESYLVGEAIRIALPTLEKQFAPFSQPVQGTPDEASVVS